MSKIEFRRQFLHIIYGPALVTLHFYGFLTLEILFGVILGGAFMSLMIKKEKMNSVRWLLAHFERDHHMTHFPGRGILFFTIGSFLSLWLFSVPTAYAGIFILSFGDGVSNLVGRHWGRVKTKLNSDKYIEGTVMGIITSIPVAYYFVPNFVAAFSASCIAMFLEMPNIRLFGFEIDDNLLIPVAASFTLQLFI